MVVVVLLAECPEQNLFLSSGIRSCCVLREQRKGSVQLTTIPDPELRPVLAYSQQYLESVSPFFILALWKLMAQKYLESMVSSFALAVV